VKRVQRVVVIFDDNTDQTFEGHGYFQETRTQRKEENGNGSVKMVPVHQVHVTVNLDVK
jgi:hypothetical protein